jgi:ubiquitin-protein ligase
MTLNQAHYALMIRRLETFKRLLSFDIVTPVRISMAYKTVDKRQFVVTISGVNSPIVVDSGYDYGKTFQVHFDVPAEFPTAIPVIKFAQPIPFHPHVYRSGDICWGTYNVGNPSNPSLIVWVVNLLYYLEYNQHPAYQMNLLSPANVVARNTYQQQQSTILRRISEMHMHRVVRCASDAESER